jgi:hypothetical protein
MLAQHGQHRGVGDAQVFADSRQGPTEVVEVDGMGDLFGRQTAAAHRYAVPMEDGADRSPLDPEHLGQFVDRRAGLVAGDQLLDLLGTELPGAPGTV